MRPLNTPTLKRAPGWGKRANKSGPFRGTLSFVRRAGDRSIDLFVRIGPSITRHPTNFPFSKIGLSARLLGSRPSNYL
jgi:hypothetical protein